MMANPHALVEGCIIAALRDPRQPRVHLHPRRGRCTRSAGVQRGRRRGVRRRATSATNILGTGYRPRRHRARRRRRVHLRRGDGAARLARGPSRPAAAQAAVPRGRRPVRLPDRRQQRRDDRAACPRIVARRRRVVRAAWAPRSRPASSCTRCPATSSAPASTRPRSASRCASCSSSPAACATGHELKFWTPGGSSTPLLTAEHLDVPLDYEARRRGRLDARHRGAHGLRRDHLRRARGRCGGPSSTSTSPAASARRAARARTGSCRSCDRLRARRGQPRTTSTSCSTCATTSWAGSFCALGDGATSPITSSIKYFRDEYVAARRPAAGCPFDPVGRHRLRVSAGAHV